VRGGGGGQMASVRKLFHACQLHQLGNNSEETASATLKVHCFERDHSQGGSRQITYVDCRVSVRLVLGLKENQAWNEVHEAFSFFCWI